MTCNRLSIYPRPRSIEHLEGEAVLPSELNVSMETVSLKTRETIQAIGNLFNGLVCIRILNSAPQRNNLIIQLCDENAMPPQGYALRFDTRGIRISASTQSGVFYGLITLCQIYRNGLSRIPYFDIEDWPDLENRGYMLDISRCKIPTMESLYSIIDSLALLKFNQLQLYTEHVFAYASHKTVWEKSSPLTADEIKEIDAYCEARYIDFVSNQNSFGHMERWLKHPEYKHLAECPNGYEHPIRGQLDHGGTLKPGEASLKFVDSLYNELLPNFSSRQMNVGCDETWELGLGASKDEADKIGKHRVYLNFIKGIHQLVRTRGLRMQFWGDIVIEDESVVPDLPKDAIALVWGYEADHPFDSQLEIFSKCKLPFYVAPGTSAWNSIGGRIENSFTNIQQAIAHAIKYGAEGCLLTDWGDFGHHQPDCISFPGIIWAGSMSWYYEGNQSRTIAPAVDLIFLSSEKTDIARLLEELGRLPKHFEFSVPNATVLNRLLFQNNNEIESWIQNITKEELGSAKKELNHLKDDIGGLESKSEDVRRIAEDLDLAVDLLLHACRKGEAHLEGEPLPVPTQKMQLEPLIERFKANWLKRNRMGGLEESVGYLLNSTEEA